MKESRFDALFVTLPIPAEQPMGCIVEPRIVAFKLHQIELQDIDATFGMKRNQIHLHGSHLINREVLFRGQKFLDAVNAMGRLEKMGEVIRVGGVYDLVIGGGDRAFGRIVESRKLIERNIAFPLVLLIPAIQRKQGRDLGSYGDLAGKTVADVSLLVGKNVVQGRGSLIGQAG